MTGRESIGGQNLKIIGKIVWRITVIAGAKRTMDPTLHKKTTSDVGDTIHYSQNHLLLAFCSVGYRLLYHPSDHFGKRVSGLGGVRFFGVGREKIMFLDHFRTSPPKCRAG